MKNLIGFKSGRLTVIDYGDTKNKRVYWKCECSCDNHTICYIGQPNLLSKTRPTRSCGCLQKENTIKALSKENILIFQDKNIVVFADDKGHQCTIDAKNYEKIKGHYWSKTARYWTSPVSKKKRGKLPPFIMLHVLIKTGEVNKNRNYVVDHIDGNTDNNLESNLRVCTQTDNCKNKAIRSNNTSGEQGVFYSKKCNKWYAYISMNKKRIHLGVFSSKQEAIIYRKIAEIIVYGEYSYTSSRENINYKKLYPEVYNKVCNKLKQKEVK